jgi:metallo-beta-lactamase family protein
MSLGGRLKNNPASVNIFGKSFLVEAEIMEMVSLSAHGDYNDLCEWLSCQDAAQVKQLFLVHGEYDAQIEFQAKLSERGFNNVIVPGLHKAFELD